MRPFYKNIISMKKVGLRDLLKILEPFKLATEYFYSSKLSNLGAVIPIYDQLQVVSIVSNALRNDSLNTIYIRLHDKLKQIEHKVRTSDNMTATALDPFWNQSFDDRYLLETYLIDSIALYASEPRNSSSQEQSRSKQSNFFSV